MASCPAVFPVTAARLDAGGFDVHDIAYAIKWYPFMGQVLIRNVDDEVLTALRARAAARGISLEAELRDVLTRAARHPRTALIAEFAAVRAKTPKRRRHRAPRRLAEELVREGRDER